MKMVIGAVLGVAALASAAELKPETVQAWDQYVQAAGQRMQQRLAPGHRFLWTDESADRAARLRQGEILVDAMTGSGTRRVPNGLIHHWVGASFIPGATLDSVLAVTHDYDHYKDIYGPKVVDSKLLACESETGRQQYSLLLLNSALFVTAALDSRYEARDFPVGRRRWYSVAHTTSVQEIEDYGSKDAHLLPPGQGNGFIWRLESIVRYEERDGGVYMELEAIALTRDIPATVRWVASPVIARLSRSTLATSLRQTREEAGVGVGLAASSVSSVSSGSCGLRDGKRRAIAASGDGY